MSVGDQGTGNRLYPSAHPGEVRKGDVVLWFDYGAQKYVEGVVIRVARDGTWAAVRYAHKRAVFPGITRLTRRVPVTSLRVIRTTK